MTALRPWQEAAVADCLSVPAGTRRLYVAPTGVGKGTATLAARDALRAAGRSALITTPSGEIARGLLDRLGFFAPSDEVSEAALWKAAEGAGIYSPVRLRNRLKAGKVAAPEILLYDEGHHGQEASVVAAALLDLAPGATWLGWTATPYRGSHKETLALREWWGEPVVLLTIAKAAEARYLSTPAPEIWPLLDDAGARVAAGGEYDEADLERMTKEQRALARLAERISAAGWITTREDGLKWDRPTLIAVASVALAHEAADILTVAGLPAAAISGDTPRAERDALLARCRNREIALCQVQVLAEGVDMPWLRRLLDLRPLRSPVAWMQLLGRITRPVEAGAKEPEYVCGCRNAERHGYLLSGQWPARKLAQETQGAFEGGRSGGGGPLERGVAKDALKGRQVARVPLLGGGAADVIHLGRLIEWGREEEILAIGVPGEEHPRVYRRDVTGGNGSRVWGRWQVAGLDAAGYAGWTRPAPAKAPSEKMAAWWRRAAAGLGLDPAAHITRREFAVLPALADTRTTLLPAREQVAARVAAVVSRDVPTGPGAQGIAPAPDFSEDPERAAVAAVEAEEAAEAAAAGEKTLLAEVERQAARVAETLAALETGSPLPATWARLREGGGWGARVADAAAEAVTPGRTLRLRTREGREAEKEVARIVAKGDGWALCEVRDPAPMPAVAEILEGRYAVEDAAGKLRFLVRGRRGWYEQAGPEIYPVRDGRLADLVAKITENPAEASRRYGRELGICGRCGQTLTDRISREIGLGPVCREKM